MALIKCIGVSFRPVGKIFFFKKDNNDFVVGEHVIVETIRGVEYGTVVKTLVEVNDDKLKTDLKSIIRKATMEDDVKHKKNLEKIPNALVKCKDCIKKHNLPMKLLDCEFTFDSSKVLFYFSAENRIVFRELVKDLASKFMIRIELRQVGVRDETKVLGGFGPCGRLFCCATYLSDFKPVTIKMVKVQGISLNPSKISGTCGRLMYCLNNEYEVYEELNKNMPYIDDIVATKDKLKGKVIGVNILKQLVKVAIELKNDNIEVREYKASELKFKKRIRVDNNEIVDNEVKALEELEKNDVHADL